jgi:hypothetical protein
LHSGSSSLHKHELSGSRSETEGSELITKIRRYRRKSSFSKVAGEDVDYDEDKRKKIIIIIIIIIMEKKKEVKVDDYDDEEEKDNMT